jgi:transcriptional regulator with XRE-family HTH domain
MQLPVDWRISLVRFDQVMSHTIGRIDPVTREALEVLGAVFRQLRAERGLSQRALAGRCGLSQSTISKLERGRAEGLRAAWIARLLAGLDGTVRILPDERPVIERCHGFIQLCRAFSRSAGTERRRARADRERADFEAWAAAKTHPEPRP